MILRAARIYALPQLLTVIIITINYVNAFSIINSTVQTNTESNNAADLSKIRQINTTNPALQRGKNMDYFDDTYRNCYFSIDGTLDGIGFDRVEQVAECEESVKFCQKVSAHYISVSFHHNEITKITMRGCDQFTVPDYPNLYKGVKCEKNGCSEQVIDDETYNICCCDEDFCNNTQNVSSLIIIMISLMYLIRL